MKKQTLELKGDEEIVIALQAGEEIVITRVRGNRKKLKFTLPDWMNAWKGRERAAQNKPPSGFRVVAR